MQFNAVLELDEKRKVRPLVSDERNGKGKIVFFFHSKRFFSSFKRKTSQRKSQNHEPGFGAKDWLAYTSTFTMVCLWLVSVSLGHFGYRLVKDMKPIYHLQKHIT